MPDLVQPASIDPEPAAPTTTVAGTPTPFGADSELPPFQALLEQQARQKAQDELANFVELQLQLEQQMQVGEWGQNDYDNAKLLATVGDEHFVKEDFDIAIESYANAAVALAGFGAAPAELSSGLTHLGASRICEPGSLQAPPLDWRKEGRGLLLPLSRFEDRDAMPAE